VKSKFIFAISLLLAISAWGRIINVPADYATIQAGIDASISGDTVLVAPGEYHEYFTISNLNILLTSSHGPDTTIIYGGCTLLAGVDSTCILRSLCLDGTGDSEASPLVNCWPGITPKIEGNILQNNYGPGIYTYGGNPIIRSNIIRRNWVRGNGGGISLGFPDFPTINAEISRNIICHNRAGFTVHGDGLGGGIFIMGNARILYNLIYDNTAYEPMYAGDGGGIWRGQLIGDTGNATIISHNTICNNIAKEGDSHGQGGGLFFSSNGAQDSLIVVNNIIGFNYWGGNVKGQPHDSMCFYWDYNLVFDDSSMGFEHGEHDIFLNPMFVDTASGNYSLLEGSPCIDAGDPSFPLDPDSTRCDIGAYFFDQGVGIDDSTPSGPYQFTLHQNYPNPFNAETIISYSLQNDAAVTLRIVAITGQLVKTISDVEHQSAGEHRVIWDGTDRNGHAVSTGIYFYELYVDDYRESKAMIMVR
jgi:parallel beta-helix repeat protein